MPASVLDERSVHRNTPLKKHFSTVDDVGTSVYLAYKTLLRLPRVKETFKPPQHRRFLMPLIGSFILIPQCIANFSCFSHSENAPAISTYVRPIMMSYFQHSCDPNVFEYCCDGQTVWFSAKSIQKGEQLCISYYSRMQFQSIKARQESLFDMYKMKCECLRCQGKEASEQQRDQLVSDSAYQFIEANVEESLANRPNY